MIFIYVSFVYRTLKFSKIMLELAHIVRFKKHFELVDACTYSAIKYIHTFTLRV